MVVPAISYLSNNNISVDALDCLRRDILNEEAFCDEPNRASLWQCLLTSRGKDYNNITRDQCHDHFERVQSSYALKRPQDAQDPLSDSDSWTAYYKDQELMAVIAQDCQRLFPEVEWYQLPRNQKSIIEVLFLWSKANPEISYKQGLHELAGIVQWVVMHDKSTVLEAATERTYIIFESILNYAKDFYATENGLSSVVIRASRINTDILAIVDHELATCLASLGIEPQLYSLRWLRLLFSREFPFDTSLVLWDLLFAADPTSNIMDYVCCAMLIKQRQTILQNDYNLALTCLMRYPATDVTPYSLVQDALQLHKRCITVRGTNILELNKTNGNSDSTKQEIGGKSLAQAPYSLNSLLEQTDRLGINHYVRGAVEEVKRNVTPIISDTRFALNRAHSKDASQGTTPSSTSSNVSLRDKELARLLSTIILDMRQGHGELDSNVHKLEEIRLVLQGQKTISEMTESPRETRLRPSSAPQALSSSPVRRGLSPIRIPAIHSKLRPSPRPRPTEDVSTFEISPDDIPLSASPPKKLSLKKAADYSFLFGDEPPITTFNKSRHS